MVWRRGGVEERWCGEGMKRYNLNASCKPTQVYTHCRGGWKLVISGTREVAIIAT